MSAILGIFYLDNRPVPSEYFRAMLQAMDNWGPDGSNIYMDGCFGFGHCLLCTTPESQYEKMPAVHSKSGIVITAFARLDNRDKLCDLFEIPHADRKTLPDGKLVSFVYERFGEHSPKHLFGDWSFAAWDPKTRKMFVARDHTGNTGIFYYYKPPIFAFASSQKALFAHPEINCKMDEWQLAHYLALFIGNQDECDRTYWQDIKLLVPAHSLTVTSKNIKLTKYWSLNDIPSFTLKSDTDYIEGFLEQFKRAVKVRLRSNKFVATTLSCGLDSGTVTALSAQLLQEKEIRLPAFTSVPLYPADYLEPKAITNEWELAGSVAKKYSNIDHIPAGTIKISPLEAIDDTLSVIGSPLHATPNLFWLFDIYRQTKKLGANVLLTGQNGNGGISWSGGNNRVLFLFLDGYLKKGMQALLEYKNKQGYSWKQTIKRHILSPILGPIWRRRYKLLHPFEPLWWRCSIINPEFADHIGLSKAMKKFNNDPVFSIPKRPIWERHRILEINSPFSYIHHFFCSAFNMEVRDPTVDIELLNFCMGVPEYLHNFDGGERMFIRRTMNGILPDEICWNFKRGKQAADVSLRLLDYKDDMERQIKLLEANKTVTQYINCKFLRKLWQNLQNKQMPHNANMQAFLLLRGVMAGKFIKKQLDNSISLYL